MFGPSGKSGRGGRGGGSSGAKRKLQSNFHSASLNRPSGRRPSAGAAAGGSSASRNSRKTTTTPPSPSAAAPSAAVEESFSLVTGNPLDFAMIIRLTPDLVDEIKRVEVQGGSARIKFDANAKNTSGNVIDVGGKDFRFTWSREMGDLCDIYEERQSGEDGNGLLVESGCAWRKLNVQRVLDESTKNHVKMRSEEAERKSKSRQAIILDHGNPSMKNQMKALAAAEANTWKMPFKQKIEPPYKKRKSEPPPGPPKSAHKHGFSLSSSKGRMSRSPLPSTPEQPPASASPLGPSSITRGYASVEDTMPTQATSKEKASSSEKGTPSRVASTALLDKSARKGSLVVKPTDLRSMLISLLTENPRGMSLKALEKSVGEYFPNSARQIEPIIRKIATYQTPGRYILKSEAELESLKNPVPGSSPENNQQAPVPGNNRGDTSDPKNSASPKSRAQIDEPVNLNCEPGEVTVSEKNDLPSPDHYVEEKVPDNSEGHVATSTDSGSDSDSESDSSDSESDSGSNSRGRSKSKSPVGSASGSSSDSESDASSNSKEGSDEEVDIMTSDDDKEPKDNLQAQRPESHASPLPWRPDGLMVQNIPDEMEDFHASEVVEIMENSPVYAQKSEIDASNGVVSNKEGEKHAPVIKASPGNSYVHPESRVYTENLHRGRDKTARDDLRHEESDRYQRKSEGKSKRRSDDKHIDGYAVHSDKVKAGSATQAPMSEDTSFIFSGSPGKCSPDSYKSLHPQITPKAVKERTDSGVHRSYNQSHPGKSISDSQLSGPRPDDISGRTKAPSGIYAENLGSNAKSTERSLQTPEAIPLHKEKIKRDIQSEDGYNNEKRPPKNPREGAVDKNLTPTDSHSRKRGELPGKIREVGSFPNSHAGYPSKGGNRSDMDRSPIVNERGPYLRREPSELELGELRDPLPEETPGSTKQFDRKGSFKQSENKVTSFDYWNSDLGKGRPAGRTGVDPMKPSPPNSDFEVVGNLKGSSKKRSPGHYEDLAKAQHKVVQSHPSHLARVNHAEFRSQPTDPADVNTKSKWNELVACQGIGPEGSGDTQRKVLVLTEQHDAVRGRPHSAKGSKRRKTDISADLGDKCKDPRLIDDHAGGKKTREFFSNDNSFEYSKYEKDEPELKGPIKDHLQYKEYVQEYQEKYDSYLSVNKILESLRNEFLQYERDLEAAKGRDLAKCKSIEEQIKKSYSQCGARHKRLKNVFIVLHKELERLKEMIKDYANSYTRD